MIDYELELRGLHYRQVRGLRALENATSINAQQTIHTHDVGSVADQPASFRVFTQSIHRRKSVERRQLDQLNAPDVQEGRGADEQRVWRLVSDLFKGSIDLTTGANLENPDFQPNGAGGRSHVLQSCFGIRKVCWIHEQRHTSGPRHKLAQKFHALCLQFIGEQIDTG